MDMAWGVVILALGLLGWLGQLTSWLRPETAVRLTLMEAEADVEPTYWADIRGEATWDSLTLWTLPLAGLMLIVGTADWPVMGLIGGAMYLYFGGRGIATRLAMQRRGLRIGAAASVRVGLAFLAIWGVAAFTTVVAAATTLWS